MKVAGILLLLGYECTNNFQGSMPVRDRVDPEWFTTGRKELRTSIPRAARAWQGTIDGEGVSNGTTQIWIPSSRINFSHHSQMSLLLFLDILM